MLNERRKKILLAIIQSHIDLNTPIGSSLITKRYPIGLSPATVRNTMASLEKMGYIRQPHTSAGRVPTEKGYRYYVNTLLKEENLSADDNFFPELYERLQKSEKGNYRLAQEAARSLSHLSHCMAVAIPLGTGDMKLEHIKFIRYDRKKILSIFISESGLIRNTFIDLEKEYSQAQLDEAAHVLNHKFSGSTLREIKDRISSQLHREKAAYDKLIAEVLYLFRDVISVKDSDITFNSFTGTSYLPDFVDIKEIKHILKAIENNNFVLQLLNHMDISEGVQVYVGMESVLPAMKELSMVVSMYNSNTHSGGAIGIIGPTRMNYKKLIPIVDHTAKTLTRILSI